MAKSKKKIVFVLLCIVILIFVGYKIFNKKNNNPVSTEMMISNAKNEKVSMPYINPEWTEYMKLTDEEKTEYGREPQMYIYKYIPNEETDYSDLPSTYNLRDEHPTTLYNQGNEGLCWAYATVELFESNLKTTRNIDAQFSVDQIDMLTMNKSYYEGDYNPYTLGRTRSSGLTFGDETKFNNDIITSGVMPVLKDKFDVNKFDYDVMNFDLNSVANVDNVDYTIAETVNFPLYQDLDDYKNMLKKYIMQYGAVRIATSANFQNQIIDYEYGDRIRGHDMVIIGWDDNLDKDNDGDPDGAWILQNSWNADAYDQYYITYSSQIFELYGVRKIIDKNWDNCYNISNYGDVKYKGLDIQQDSTLATVLHNKQYDGDYDAISGTVMVTYNKPDFKNEKLKMINFVSASQNSNYKVYVSPDGTDGNYQFIKEVNTDFPGLYTVEMDNIDLENNKFSIKIESEDGAMYTTINAFTCNGENTTESDTITSYVDEGYYNENGNYEYHIISNAPNEEDGKLIHYSLKDSDGNFLLSTVKKNALVRNGQAVGKIEFPSSFEIGKKYYVLIVKDDEIIDTLEILYSPKLPDGSIEGNGTEENPYVITNAYQLSLISHCPDANYVLGNDIDLEYNPENDATFNRGIGWKPIEIFRGKLDGHNYTISNMRICNNANISLSEYYKIGLFAEIDGATITNLNIKNAQIIIPDQKKNDVGILAGWAKNVKIENVMVSGNIEKKSFIETEYAMGLLIGYLGGSQTESVQFNNITCQGSINSQSTNRVGGMIGRSYPQIILENSLITTDIISNASGMLSSVGGIVGAGHVISVKNSYIIPEMNVKTPSKLDTVSSSTAYPLTELKNVVVYENNHATSIEEFKNDANNNIISSNNIEDLKNITLAQSGLDSQKWEYINGNPYPTLKGQQIKFAKDIEVPSEISLNKEETKTLVASIKDADSTYKKLEYKTSDESIANIDENGNIIAGKNDGTATITVSTCDGSYITKEVKVTVGDVIVPYKINLYDCNEDKKIIDNILPTTIEHYKENINLQEPYTAKVFKGEEEVTEGNIASGMITKIYLNGESVAEYINIVPGDVDGDGKISSRDVSKVGQYLEGLNIINEQNESYILPAMDFTRDGKVTQNDKEDIQKYVVGIIKRIEEIYYGLIEPYKINKYNSDEEKKTISNIFPATIEHYKENINIQNPYTVKVFKGNEEITEGNIATGMITKIYLNDEILAEYTNIVPGDVYMDGKISSRDAGMTQQYLIGMLDNLYETPQYYAMDFTRDGKVRLNDVELIMRYGVKLYEPSEEDYYGENN